MRTIVIACILAVLVVPASAEFKIWERVDPIDGGGEMRSNIPWPPEGTQWHNLRPAATACSYGTQTGHDDQDGDGFIDACENVQIDGVWEHIEWAGPTLHMWNPQTRETLIVEPVGTPGGDRAEYHVVSPLYCAMVELPAGLQVCDFVTILNPPEFAGEWHIEEIKDNIHSNGGSPVELSTWSQIKNWFKSLVD